MENTVNLGAYSKSITYIGLTALTFLVTAFADNNLTTDELINLAIVVLGAIGVYALPNLPDNVAKYAKTGVAFATAGLVALLSFLTDGVTPTEWMQIILAAFAAVGVYIVPNTEKQVQAVEVVAIAPEASATVETLPVAETLTGPISDAGVDGKTGERV